MMRWILEIEEFGPIFYYVPGEQNVVADALSGLPVYEQNGFKLEENAVNSRTPANTMAAAESDLFTMDLRVPAKAQKVDVIIGPVEKQGIGGMHVLVHPQTKKVLVPKSIRDSLLKTYHEWLIHSGGATMKNTIAQFFHWAGMEKDVRTLVCLKAKHPTVRYGKLLPKTLEVWSWFEIAVNSIGPYGPQKFRALSIIDTATRLMELLPVINPISTEAAYLVDRHWLCRYPRPVRCIHDSESEFKREFAERLESYGIESVPTATCNPQANAVIKLVHRVIGEKMRTQEITTSEEWENFLHNTTVAARASNHSMLKASPVQLAFGRDMLVDLEHKADWETEHLRKGAASLFVQ
ncbi:unnamed protein product [Phytophthora fragariaefolia]|uniref:Unnamed protein product n=1 Tax=Phytophthora fragariaefolia TaxID=1490495 RepID=A0A9W6XVN3_9STRA|nr:unnamed protein product [Phytophthora fragariaefolia]